MLRATAALLGAAVLLAGCYKHPNFKSVDVTGAEWGKALAFIGRDGKRRTLADFKGKLVVLTFVQVLFLTLDPERDTGAVLAKYVRAFDPTFLGLYGDAEATRRTAQEFKISFEKRKGAAPGKYSVDHSAQSYVLDVDGRLRLLVKHERIAADLAQDLKELLHQAARHAEDAGKT